MSEEITDKLGVAYRTKTVDKKVMTAFIVKGRDEPIYFPGDHVYSAYTGISGSHKALKLEEDGKYLALRSSEIVAAYLVY